MMSLVDVRLIPFYLSVVVYFILYEPIPREKVDAAIVKAVPIWLLALFVYTTEETLQSDYSHLFVHALVLSSIGDICLVWPKAFAPGILFFASAHVCYFLGILQVFHLKLNYMSALFVLLGMCLYFFISDGIKRLIMKVLFAIYESLIVGVGCMAIKHYVYTGTKWAFFGACGYGLFMFSDGLLAVNRWKGPVAMADFFVMASYYAAQMFLALSTVKQ